MPGLSIHRSDVGEHQERLESGGGGTCACRHRYGEGSRFPGHQEPGGFRDVGGRLQDQTAHPHLQ